MATHNHLDQEYRHIDFHEDDRIIRAFNEADKSLTSIEMKMRQFCANRKSLSAVFLNHSEGFIPKMFSHVTNLLIGAGVTYVAIGAVNTFAPQLMSDLGLDVVNNMSATTIGGGFALASIFRKTGNTLFEGVTTIASMIDSTKYQWDVRKHNDAKTFLNTTANIINNPFKNYTELEKFCVQVVEKTHAFKYQSFADESISSSMQAKLWAKDLAMRINLHAGIAGRNNEKISLSDATLLAMRDVKWSANNVKSIKVIDLGATNPSAYGRYDFEIETTKKFEFQRDTVDITSFFEEQHKQSLELRSYALSSKMSEKGSKAQTRSALNKAARGIGIAAFGIGAASLSTAADAGSLTQAIYGPASALGISTAALMASKYDIANKAALVYDKSAMYLQDISSRASWKFQIKTSQNFQDPAIHMDYDKFKALAEKRIDAVMEMSGIKASNEQGNLDKQRLVGNTIKETIQMKISHPDLHVSMILGGLTRKVAEDAVLRAQQDENEKKFGTIIPHSKLLEEQKPTTFAKPVAINPNAFAKKPKMSGPGF